MCTRAGARPAPGGGDHRPRPATRQDQATDVEADRGRLKASLRPVRVGSRSRSPWASGLTTLSPTRRASPSPRGWLSVYPPAAGSFVEAVYPLRRAEVSDRGGSRAARSQRRRRAGDGSVPESCRSTRPAGNSSAGGDIRFRARVSQTTSSFVVGDVANQRRIITTAWGSRSSLAARLVGLNFSGAPVSHRPRPSRLHVDLCAHDDRAVAW